MEQSIPADTRTAAFHIPLTNEQAQMLGEICAIQGQIEHVMLLTVSELLSVGDSAARSILGSTTLANNSDIWLRTVQQRLAKYPDLVAVAEAVSSELSALVQGRNDYIHAVFGYAAQDSFGMYVNFGAAEAERKFHGVGVAARVRNDKQRPLEEIESVRDKAARLSRMVAHVYYAHLNLRGGNGPVSPWQGTF